MELERRILGISDGIDYIDKLDNRTVRSVLRWRNIKGFGKAVGLILGAVILGAGAWYLGLIFSAEEGDWTQETTAFLLQSGIIGVLGLPVFVALVRIAWIIEPNEDHVRSAALILNRRLLRRYLDAAEQGDEKALESLNGIQHSLSSCFYDVGLHDDEEGKTLRERIDAFSLKNAW